MWRIKKMSDEHTSSAGLECLAPQVPVYVTLEDTDTGTVDTIGLCWRTDGGVSDMLDALTTAGYTPSDWEE